MDNDWGSLKVFKVESGSDFWALLSELLNDKSDFLHNLNIIVESFKDGNLYSIRVVETDSMYRRGAHEDSIFVKGTFFVLPCICIIEQNCAEIIWVHTRARRKGFASHMIEELNVNKVNEILPGSEEFWKYCDILPTRPIVNKFKI